MLSAGVCPGLSCSLRCAPCAGGRERRPPRAIPPEISREIDLAQPVARSREGGGLRLARLVSATFRRALFRSLLLNTTLVGSFARAQRLQAPEPFYLSCRMDKESRPCGRRSIRECCICWRGDGTIRHTRRSLPGRRACAVHPEP